MSNIRSIVPIQFYSRGKRTQASTECGSFDSNYQHLKQQRYLSSLAVQKLTNLRTYHTCLPTKIYEVLEKKIS